MTSARHGRRTQPTEATQVCNCGRATAGATLCDRCTKTLAYAIPNIAAYYDDLETMATKRAKYGSTWATKGSIGKAQPLPVDMRFVNGTRSLTVKGRPLGGSATAPGNQLQWDTWNTIVEWCRTLRTELPNQPGPTRTTVRSMCHYLDLHFTHATRQPWAEDLLDELTNLEGRLARFVDRPADRWYAGKCSIDNCTFELYATVDRGTVTCKACGVEHDVAGRRTFLLTEAKEYLVTATEAAGALLAWTDYDGTEEKLVDRIRKWRDRDKLNVQDVTSLLGKDRHLYRLGDVQELMIRHAQREQLRPVSGAV